MEPIFSCPTGSTLNENKMCVMAPIMSCPGGYTLVNNKCELSNVTAESPPPTTVPPPPQPQLTSNEPKCPTGYEFRDSMCYPLKI